MRQLLTAFENALFASAADEHNERASEKGISERYERVQVTRSNLIRAIEELEESH